MITALLDNRREAEQGEMDKTDTYMSLNDDESEDRDALASKEHTRLVIQEWRRTHPGMGPYVPPKHSLARTIGVGIYWVVISIVAIIGAFLVVGWFGLIAWGAQH